MGVVHAVHDRRLDRDAALKRLRPEVANQPHLQARFLREVEVTARLVHPNVPPVYEGGLDAQGQPYLLMKRIEGENLSLRIRGHDYKAPMTRAERSWIREQVEDLVRIAQTVAHAHEQGIVHRDLKSENVQVGSFGDVMVLDWGIARDLEGSIKDVPTSSAAEPPREAAPGARAVHTQSNTTLGTPGYMAPEQVGNPKVDARADVFALGAILTELLTGRLPVSGSSSKRLKDTKAGRLSLPRDLRRGVPPELNSIAARALAADPEQRTQTATELVHDLEAFLLGERVSAHRYRPSERARRWAGRHPTLLLASGVVLLSLGVAGSLLLGADARARATLRAAAEERAEERKITSEALRTLPPAARTARALRSLQAAARWDQLDDAQAASRAHFEAAMLLAQTAEESAQWDLAAQAYAQASRLGVDAAAASRGRQRVQDARAAETKRRVAEVTDLLDRAESGKLLEHSEGVANAVFAVVRYPQPEVVALLVQRLRALPGSGALTDEQQAIRRLTCEALGRIGQHAPAGLDMSAAVAALARCLEAATEQEAALLPGVALVRIGSEAALTAVHEARRRLDVDGAFSRRVSRYLSSLSAAPPGEIEQSGSGEWFLRVEELFARGLHEQVIAACDQQLETHPEDPLAFNLRGNARQALGQNRQAIADFGRALELYPHADSYSNRAEARRRAGDFQGALADYNEAVALDPEHARAYTGRGVVRKLLGDTAGALADTERAVELEPNSAQARNMRGLARRAAGDLSGALADHTAAIQFDPRYASAYYNRGKAREDSGDPRGALADYDRALALDPKDVQALLARGLSRHALGNTPGAIADCDRAIELDPQDPQTYTNRATLYLALGDPRRALQDLSRAISLAPAAPLPYQNRGAIRRRLRDFPGAVEDLTRALELDPTSAEAYYGRGLARKGQRDLQGAVADYDQAIRLRPDERFHTSRGLVRNALGDRQGAMADYDRALNINPRHVTAYNNRGNLRSVLGDPAGALADYDRAIEIDPRYAQAYVNRGASYIDLGDPRTALRDLERALELDPRLPDAQHVRGLVAKLRAELQAAEEPQ